METLVRKTAVTENEWVAARGSGIHGRGLFARRDIPAGTRVVEYVGELISKVESARRCESGNEYVFTFDETWDIDGDVDWNLARLSNHSCEPNCEALFEEERIWLVAARGIRAGEEVTFNYGYDLEDYHEHPCRCGSSTCVGYMVAEEWVGDMRRLEAQRARGLQTAAV